MKFSLSMAFAVALVVVVQIQLGWQTILEPWTRLSGVEVTVAVCLFFLSYMLRTLRLAHYYKLMGSKAQLGLSFKLMLLLNFWNNILPLRSGEISFPILMKRYFNIEPLISLPGLLWFRLLDLTALLVMVVMAVVISQQSLVLAVIVSLMIFILVLALFPAMPWLLSQFKRLIPAKFHSHIETMQLGLPQSIGDVVYSLLWTVANWLVKLVTFTWVLIQFTPANFIQGFAGAIGGEITSVLPIHGFAGIGSYEAGIVAGLIPQGIDSKAALSGAVNLHMFLLSCTFIGGLISLLIPFNRTRR